MYLFSSILGIFVFDGNLNVVDEILFSTADDSKNREKFIEKIRSRHKSLKEPDEVIAKKILLHFKNRQFFGDFCNKNLQLTKSDVKNSVSDDVLLIQSISLIDDLDKAINLLVKRLREWYELYNPEFSRAVEHHEKFVMEILEKGKNELLNEISLSPLESFGADLEQENLEPIKSFVHQVFDLYQLRKLQENYISALMDRLCPNIKAVCGTLLAARLIEHAGSLRRLSGMPASTIQILGAEKALFRHMKTGAKPPRHGIIINHPLVSKAPEKMHGKVSRALSDKIAIAAKVDYFSGKFIGGKLKEGLEKKFGKW
jgi:nucleolar protein 56